eukprot:c9058_g1_i1.p1 GENE.c9058_g1_i1~~c9058_g1_i1.p1  ORF type:complete len:313 (+),score=103.48 c9058_g1_i1:49-939(+)
MSFEDETHRHLILSIPDSASTLTLDVFDEDKKSRTSASLTAMQTLLKVHKFLQVLGLIDPFEIVFALVAVWCGVSFVLSFVGSIAYLGTMPLIVSLIAWARIRSLGSLSQQIGRFAHENDRLAAENNKFQEQNKQLAESVSVLKTNVDEFRSQNSRLQQSISDLNNVREMLEQYATTASTNLNQIIETIRSSVSEQRQIQEQTLKIQKSALEQTRKQEYAMMMNLYFQFQNMDGEKGMSFDEFETFLDLVPRDLREKLKKASRETFEAADVDHNGVVSVNEIREWMDRALVELSRA